MNTTVTFPNMGLELNISRVAFRIGEFEFYWYGILIGLGLLLGMWFALSKAREFGLDQDRFIDIILIGAIAGVIGARVYYVVFAEPGEFTTFWDIFNLRRGGLAFYGAVIFGVGAGVLACRWRKCRVLPVCDLAALGFLIGQGIGRWGNFFNQEAFGTNTTLPWGMLSAETKNYLSSRAADLAAKGMIVDPAQAVHPTFLYESLWCLLGFVLLYFYIKRRKFDGEIFLMYIAWNGFGRAFIEGLRTDSLYIGTLRVSQVLAIVSAIAALLIIAAVRNKMRKSDDEEYLIPYGHTAEAKDELEELDRLRLEKKSGKAGVVVKAETKEPEPEPEAVEEAPAGKKSAKKIKIHAEEPAEIIDESRTEPAEKQKKKTAKPKEELAEAPPEKLPEKKPARKPKKAAAEAPKAPEPAQEPEKTPKKKTYKTPEKAKQPEKENQE